MTDKGLADADVSGTHERYAVRHFRAQVSAEGVNKNQAESFFSRLRRWKNGVSGGVRPVPIAHLPEDVLLHATAQGRGYMFEPSDSGRVIRYLLSNDQAACWQYRSIDHPDFGDRPCSMES